MRSLLRIWTTTPVSPTQPREGSLGEEKKRTFLSSILLLDTRRRSAILLVSNPVPLSLDLLLRRRPRRKAQLALLRLRLGPILAAKELAAQLSANPAHSSPDAPCIRGKVCGGEGETPCLSTHPSVVCEDRTYPSVACFGAMASALRFAAATSVERKRRGGRESRRCATVTACFLNGPGGWSRQPTCNLRDQRGGGARGGIRGSLRRRREGGRIVWAEHDALSVGSIALIELGPDAN